MLQSETRQTAFFDLDRCLVLDDTIGGFSTRLVQRGLLPKRMLAEGALAYLLYRLNLADPALLVARGVHYLRDLEESILYEAGQRFYDDVVRFRLRRSVLDALERHQAEGHLVVLLTGGLPYVPRPLAEHLGFDACCSTIPEVADGRLTGRVIEPPCVGDGKIVHAHKAATTIGGRLEDAWFYTDSYSDLPMLRLAQHPVVVNPDRKLARWAWRHKVEVLDG
ncbi:MAG: HAD-IB family hydrolase [Candidatus Dadabacteria bacterium]|nr:MAG: HAD-IB family hydrolase [Candidatus Dadabacteria bacterium]